MEKACIKFSIVLPSELQDFSFCRPYKVIIEIISSLYIITPSEREPRTIHSHRREKKHNILKHLNHTFKSEFDEEIDFWSSLICGQQNIMVKFVHMKTLLYDLVITVSNGVRMIIYIQYSNSMNLQNFLQL